MSAALPETVDVWRMVAAKRRFAGSAPLHRFARLRDSLANDDGEVRYELEFGRDETGVPFLELHARTSLPLICQRTLQAFPSPVSISQRLALIAREQDEAALSSGYEPLLVPTGELHLADVIEDELILALPVVPVAPGTESEDDVVWSSGDDETEVADAARANPFAELRRLKKKS